MSIFTLVKAINNKVERIKSTFHKIKGEDYQDLPSEFQEKIDLLEKEIQSLHDLFEAHIENNKFILQEKVQNNLLILIEDIQEFSDLTLDQALIKLLSVTKKGLTAKQIEQLLLKYGYQTTSMNLYAQVRLNLHLLKKNEGIVYSTPWAQWFIKKRSFKVAAPHERLRKTLAYFDLNFRQFRR